MNAQFELELGDTVAIRRRDKVVVINGPRESHGRVIKIYTPWWASQPRYIVAVGYGDTRYEARYKRNQIRFVDPELALWLDALVGADNE